MWFPRNSGQEITYFCHSTRLIAFLTRMERYAIFLSKISTSCWDWFSIVWKTRYTCITNVHQSSSSLMRVPVIKVYGIYRHSELGRIWNALGNHLARRGAEYRRRLSIHVTYYATYWVIVLSDAFFVQNQLTTLFCRPHSRRRNPSRKFQQAHWILVLRTWSMLSVYILRLHSDWSVCSFNLCLCMDKCFAIWCMMIDDFLV
jgi:hypothetical protein